MPSISYQLYSSRAWDDEDTLTLLEELGITEVEGYGPFVADPARTMALLNKHGMTMPTAHMALDMLEGDFDGAITTASALGLQVLIVPFLAPGKRPTTTEDWRDFVQRLALIARKVTEAGFSFAWHNHAFELDPVEGVMPLDLIAAASDDIKIELDLAWVQVAGEDPIAWLEKLSGRIVATHVKDVAPLGKNEDEDGWADVGHGVLDWKAITSAMDAAKVPRYVIEHDRPRDHRRMATRSVTTVRSLIGASR